jgi:hypothetical protein
VFAFECDSILQNPNNQQWFVRIQIQPFAVSTPFVIPIRIRLHSCT